MREGGEGSGSGVDPTGWWGEVLKAVGDRRDGWFFSKLGKSIGDGRDTLFWEECWAGNTPLKLAFTRLFNLCCEKSACVREMGE